MNDVARAFQQRATQVSNGVEVLLSKVQDWQVIKQYMSNRNKDIKLNDRQDAKMKRYQFIYSQQVSGKYTDHEVLNQLMKFFDIEMSQAYEDMNATREIIPFVVNLNKKFELQLEYQLAKKARIKCEEMGDMKTAAAYSKVIADLLKQVEEQEETPAELFEGHTIEAVFDPRLLGIAMPNMKELLATINAKRNKKINIDTFPELSYEAINNE